MDHQPEKVWSASSAPLGPPELAVIARSMIAARRALVGPLPAELVPDPSLDILLNLFAAHGVGRTLSPEALVERTTVTPSVANRWIDVLSQYGLLSVSPASTTLTAKGIDAVTATLRAVAESQWHLDDAT